MDLGYHRSNWFLVKISWFKFLDMTEWNISVINFFCFRLFFISKVFRILDYFLCQNFTPWKKWPPFFPAPTPPKNWDPVKPPIPFWKFGMSLSPLPSVWLYDTKRLYFQKRLIVLLISSLNGDSIIRLDWILE